MKQCWKTLDVKPDGTSPSRPVSGSKDWLIFEGYLMIVFCFCRTASWLDIAQSRCGGDEWFPTLLAGCVENCPAPSSETRFVLQNWHAHKWQTEGWEAASSLSLFWSGRARPGPFEAPVSVHFESRIWWWCLAGGMEAIVCESNIVTFWQPWLIAKRQCCIDVAIQFGGGVKKKLPTCFSFFPYKSGPASTACVPWQTQHRTCSKPCNLQRRNSRPWDVLGWTKSGKFVV